MCVCAWVGWWALCHRAAVALSRAAQIEEKKWRARAEQLQEQEEILEHYKHYPLGAQPGSDGVCPGARTHNDTPTPANRQDFGGAK